MTESQQLLADYADSGSETAFRELVARYIALVYSTALRLVEGDAASAEDVTQTVFLHLSRNARKLARESLLGGWLHRDTCYVAAAARSPPSIGSTPALASNTSSTFVSPSARAIPPLALVLHPHQRRPAG